MNKFIFAALLFAGAVGASSASQRVDVNFDRPVVKNQISVAEPVSISLADGAWAVDGTRSVWTYEVNTPNAETMSFAAHVALPFGAELRAGNENITRTYGADLISKAGVLNGVPVTGNTLKFEIDVASVDVGKVQFVVDKIYAGNKSVTAKSATVKGSALSIVNYSCAVAESNIKAARSTVQVFITNSSGQEACTGSLVSDATGSGKHNILTAAHCGTSDGWKGADVTTLWGRVSNCAVGTQASTSVNGPMASGYTTTAVVTKAKIPNNANTYNGDTWVLQSSNAPPTGSNPYWSGIYAKTYPVANNGLYGTGQPTTGLTFVYNVSHPLAQTKAYAESTQSVDNGDGCRGGDFDCEASYGVYWTRGENQDGSSGGGLLNQDGLLIGTLSGCSTDETFCSFANVAENWLGDQSTTGLQPAGYYVTLKEALDPTNTGNLQFNGFEDATRPDNLTTFLSSDVVTANASNVNLSVFTDEAVSCNATSSPTVAGWNGSLTVSNGSSTTTSVMIPSSQQYTLTLTCTNSSNFSSSSNVVVNAGSNSGGGTTTGSTGGGGSSGGSSGGGGGAAGFLLLIPVIGVALARRRKK